MREPGEASVCGVDRHKVSEWELGKASPVTTTQVGKLSAVTTSGKGVTRRMVLGHLVVDSRRKRLGDIDKNQDRQREKRVQ